MDAKSENTKFNNQIYDYMELEQNENFIGFQYNGSTFRCFVKGVLKSEEEYLKNKDHYKEKYFPVKKSNALIVNNNAKKLANLFRYSNIDKQLNVPFIGLTFLNIMYGQEIDLSTTKSIIFSLKKGLNNIIEDTGPIVKRQKKEFLIKILAENTLNQAKFEDMLHILNTISNIYNFINISQIDYEGYDIMNSFLKVFRKWNSANANEKGEVFTPDHIAQLMYELAYINYNNTVLDPTCGSGTFLTNSMALMIKDANNQAIINRDDTIDDIKSNQILGIELNQFNATLSGINMLLHKDGSSNIYNGNCFKMLSMFDNLYDRVLMNPPFSVKEPELKFVNQTLKYMKNDGYLATILPKTVLKGTEKKNVDLLEEIFKTNELVSVISLPNDLFLPNAGVATAIVVFHKNNDKFKNPKYKDTIFIDLSNDGYTLKTEYREDTNSWDNIKKEVLKAYNKNKFNEFRAIRKKVDHTNELLFESFGSNRALEVEKETFIKYIRENIAAKTLCGIQNNLVFNEEISLDSSIQFERFKISDLIFAIGKGKNKKSIDRKLENKFIDGIPLIIAKKDNNGVGGLTIDYNISFKNKIVIISGGDGGGGKTYYCDFEFCATSFALICDLKPEIKNKFDTYSKFYLATAISERLYKTVNHGRTISKIPDNIEILLPTKNNQIYFKYMSNFIKNLQILKK